MKKKVILSLFLFMGSIFIVACSNESEVEDDIHVHLTEMVEIEKDIDALQKDINVNANSEQGYYEDIIGLSVDEQEDLPVLIEHAEEELANSEDIIYEIKDHMLKNTEKLDTFSAYSEKLNTKEKQATFTELYKLMDERVQTMEYYYDTYLETISTSAHLYELFISEGMQTENVYRVIEEVNEKYEALMEMNDDINSQTENVNTQKKKFYKLMNG